MDSHSENSSDLVYVDDLNSILEQNSDLDSFSNSSIKNAVVYLKIENAQFRDLIARISPQLDTVQSELEKLRLDNEQIKLELAQTQMDLSSKDALIIELVTKNKDLTAVITQHELQLSTSGSLSPHRKRQKPSSPDHSSTDTVLQVDSPELPIDCPLLLSNRFDPLANISEQMDEDFPSLLQKEKPPKDASSLSSQAATQRTGPRPLLSQLPGHAQVTSAGARDDDASCDCPLTNQMPSLCHVTPPPPLATTNTFATSAMPGSTASTSGSTHPTIVRLSLLNSTPSQSSSPGLNPLSHQIKASSDAQAKDKPQNAVPSSSSFSTTQRDDIGIDPHTLSNDLPFDSDDPPQMEPDNTGFTRENRRSIRIPPVTIRDIPNWLQLREELTRICSSRFTAKTFGSDIKIQFKTIADYRAAAHLLQARRLQHIVFHLPSEPTLRVVIKRVHSSIPIEEIRNELESHNIDIVKITRLRHAATSTASPLILVQLTNTPSNKGIYHLTDICGTSIQVEPFKKKSNVVQCYNCQGFGHGALSCHLTTRCVKCSGQHPSRDCKLPQTSPPRCVNCLGPHVASFRGCPKFPLQSPPSTAASNTVHSIPPPTAASFPPLGGSPGLPVTSPQPSVPSPPSYLTYAAAAAKSSSHSQPNFQVLLNQFAHQQALFLQQLQALFSTHHG